MQIALHLAAFAAFFVKGVVGFANTLVFTTTLSFFMPGRSLAPLDLLIGFPANILVAVRERKSIRLRVALPLMAMLLAGMVSGVLFLQNSTDRLIKQLLGALVIALAVEMFLRRRSTKKAQPKPWLLLVIGLASGFLCGAYGIGAFLVAYLGRTSRSTAELRGTICFVLLADNLARIGMYWFTGLLNRELLFTALTLLPAMALGLGAGLLAARRIPERLAQNLVILVLLLMGTSVLVTNLL